jgi:saccharopine dehydrogenase-like NADP-dependent oxidoreductase
MHTVLIIGGYGFFGKRIAASLATNPLVRVLVGGRRLDQATAFTESIGLPRDRAVGIDASADNLATVLANLEVDTVVHTAGPFQKQNYNVANAAITARCNYIDLADGRDFVAGIDSLHQSALDRGVTIISGASSVPGLSSAVINRYVGQFQRLDAVRMGIASGARTPGIATVKAIFGYCGKPFLRKEAGAWANTYGWLDLTRHHFPEPVGPRWLGSCDIPDLALFPKTYPSVQTVTFQAGYASDTGHLFVWALAGLVKLGVLPSLLPFASVFNKVGHSIESLVSDKGAMFVSLEGIDLNGRPLQKTWNIIASQNHGPHIPCGASIALVNKLAQEEPLPKGAMPCIGLLTVEEYLASLRDLDVVEACV